MNTSLHPFQCKPLGSRARWALLWPWPVQTLPLHCVFLLCFLLSRSHAVKLSGSDWNGAWYANQFGRQLGRRWALPFSIKVRTSSHNAPRDRLDANDFYHMDQNVLTIAIRSEEPIGLIKLSLPARQQCYAQGKICDGYTFVEGMDPLTKRRLEANKVIPRAEPVTFCALQSVPNKEALKSDHEVIDVVDKDLVELCSIDNKFGDETSDAKRSLMKLYLKDEPGMLKGNWLVFQIKVRNPSQTPQKLDDEGRIANTFQVVLKSPGGGMFLGSRVIAAGKIFSIWECGYSPFTRSSTCTASCGGGVRYLVRRLLHPPPPGYPAELLINCSNPLTQMEECHPEPCTQECLLGEWTRFADGDCSVTCGKGLQVERRRVVQAPINTEKPCPRWDEDEVRVRLRPCWKGECEKPRCELASADDMDGHVETKCSEVCGEDSYYESLQVAVAKEENATMETCGQQWKTMSCDKKQCEKLEFAPYDWEKLPKLDTWTDMEMTFQLTSNAQKVFVYGPKDFQIGADADSRCILKEHNLPLLRNCTVTVTESGSAMLFFDFFNPLERETVDGKEKRFKVRLWIKPPANCPKGLDDTEACTDVGDWMWKLKTAYKDEKESCSDDFHGFFKVYAPHAKVTDVRKAMEAKKVEVAVGSTAKAALLQKKATAVPVHPAPRSQTPFATPSQAKEIKDKLAKLNGQSR